MHAHQHICKQLSHPHLRILFLHDPGLEKNPSMTNKTEESHIFLTCRIWVEHPVTNVGEQVWRVDSHSPLTLTYQWCDRNMDGENTSQYQLLRETMHECVWKPCWNNNIRWELSIKWCEYKINQAHSPGGGAGKGVNGPSSVANKYLLLWKCTSISFGKWLEMRWNVYWVDKALNFLFATGSGENTKLNCYRANIGRKHVCHWSRLGATRRWSIRRIEHTDPWRRCAFVGVNFHTCLIADVDGGVR